MPSTDTAAIRAWALANGHPVGDRGRLPAEVVSAYQSAQGPAAAMTAGKPAAKKATTAAPRTARTTAPKKVAKAPAKVASAEHVKIVTDELPPALTAPPTPTARPIPTAPAAPAAPMPPAASPPTPARLPSAAKVTPASATVESRLAAVEAKLTEALRRLEALETPWKRKFGRRS